MNRPAPITPAVVICPNCRQKNTVNGRQFLVSDRGLHVRPGRSDHCPNCLYARPAGTILQWYRTETRVNGRRRPIRPLFKKEVALLNY